MEWSYKNFQPLSSERKFQATTASPNRYFTGNSRWVPRYTNIHFGLKTCLNEVKIPIIKMINNSWITTVSLLIRGDKFKYIKCTALVCVIYIIVLNTVQLFEKYIGCLEARKHATNKQSPERNNYSSRDDFTLKITLFCRSLVSSFVQVSAHT